MRLTDKIIYQKAYFYITYCYLKRAAPNLNTNFVAGQFEYVVATNSVGTSGGTVTLSSSLVNTYTNANYSTQGQKRFQVIRVPQYTSVTLGGTLTAPAWNGATGGIVVMDIAGTLNMAGNTIDVSGKGFRGGGGRALSGGTGANTDVVTLSTNNANASKGEGTAGTPKYLYDPTITTVVDTGAEGYPSGSYGRGAPGNAGGGGTDGNTSNNDQNAGGGGGSNGGVGGKGGNTWNSNLPYGGVGGAAFSVTGASRLVLGGGGGAGTTNDGTGTPGSGLASSGAAGGGAVLIRTGSVGTAGIINANGGDVTLTPANDASGGGGAGGSVLVISKNNSASGLTINAKGGKGGSNTGGGSNHGPGGGGGGGVVYASSGISTALTGGIAGTTFDGGYNGATGGNGLSGPVSVTPVDATTSISGANCVPQLTVNKSTSTPAVFAGSTATYTITVANAANVASATQVDISDALPTGFTYASLGSVTLTGSATRTTTSNPTTGATNPSFGKFTIPGGGQVQITFTVDIGAATTAGTYQNPVTATYLDPARTTSAGTTTATYNSASSTAEDVTVSSQLSVSGTVFSDADADVTINGSDAGTNTGSGTLTIYAINTAGNVINKATVGANGTYTLSNIPANASVTLRLSNDASVAVGATAPTTATIPSGWYFTGENKNGTTDGTIATLGNIALTTATSDISNQTFGIRQATVIAPDAAPATCTPDYRTQLNTGVSAVGGQLAAGTNDLNWTAEWIAGPASGIGTPYAIPRPVGVMPAVVTGNLALGAWINEPANARWISYPFRLSSNSNGNHQNADLDSNTGEDGSGIPIVGTSDAVRLKFTASLTLPSNANTISVSLPIGVAVDNQFTSIKVNGIENLSPVPTPNSQAAGYSSLQNINVTQGWQAGVNTIEVTVDSGPPLAGFFLAINAASTQVCGPANVLLVKRITEIAGDRAKNPNDPTFPLNQALNRPSFAADDPSPTNNWPSNFLVGAYDAGRIKPGDTVEYTVYFMNSSGADISNAKFCDRIVGNQTFVAGAYGGSGKDIEYKLGTNPVQYLTQASDTTIDRAYLNPSTGVIPGCPAPTISGTNHGSLVIDVTGTGSSGQVDLTALPGATTGTVTPNPSSYGYFRFKTIIDP